jgi:hypothetical protein
VKATLGWAFLFFLLLCALELLAILQLNNGLFSYSLDDPYIHLALAEEIFAGNYGINPHEVCAPSSSILWPFLLAAFAPFSFFVFVPLAYNILTSLVSIFLLQRLLDRAMGRCPLWLLMFLIIALNLVGLTFTGMEHSLHVTLSLLAVLGVTELHLTQRIPWYLWMACVVGVWVRYEHLAVVGATSLLLFLSQQRKAAVSLFLASLVVPLGFGGRLRSLGLSWVPTSVLSKSSTTSSGLSGVLEVFGGNVANLRGMLLLLGILLVIWFASQQGSKERLLSLWVSLVVLGHLFFGRMGWFYRYEGYVFAVLLLVLIFFLRSQMARLRLVRVWALLLLHAPLFTLLITPRATNDIYLQQYQLHRFSTEFYQGPIAVNDIGQIAFRNDQYILDLWGLASLEAATLIKTDRRWAETLVRKHKIPVVAIYAEILKEPPQDWIELGSFQLGRAQVTAAYPRVVIYVTPEADITIIREQTRRFFESLPAGATYELR